MYGLWHNNLKLKYAEKEKSCYKEKDSFIVYTKIEDINVYVAGDIETRVHTLIYELAKTLSKGKNKKKLIKEKRRNWKEK